MCNIIVSCKDYVVADEAIQMWSIGAVVQTEEHKAFGDKSVPVVTYFIDHTHQTSGTVVNFGVKWKTVLGSKC